MAMNETDPSAQLANNDYRTDVILGTSADDQKSRPSAQTASSSAAADIQCPSSPTSSWSDYDPRREDNLAYIIFFILGLGSLLPWNAYINASHYYLVRFCEQSFESTFESYFSMCYTASQPLTLILTIYYKDHLPLKLMVLIPLIIYTIIFIITTILTAIPGIDPVALFVITVIFTFLCGVCSSIISGGLYGLAGMLMPKHIAALMSGQSLIGVIVSLISLLVIAVHGNATDFCGDDATASDDDTNMVSESTSTTCTPSDEVDYGAFAFFLVATIVLAICVVLFLTLLRLDFVKNAMGKFQSPSSSSARKYQSKYDSIQHSSEIAMEDSDSNVKHLEVTAVEITDDPSPLKNSLAVEANNQDDRSKVEVDKYHVFKVFTIIRKPAISGLILYMGSIMVFPPLIVLMQSTERCKSNLPIHNELWVSLLFILFNIGDFIGRICAQMWADRSMWNAQNVWIPSTLRFIIVVLLFFCKVGNSRMPMFLDHDAAPIVLTTLLGLSCGFFANIAMMQAPSLVPAEDASLVGTTMVFCLISGLLIGACLSYLVLFIVIGPT